MNSYAAAQLLQVRIESDHVEPPRVAVDIREAAAPCILITPPEIVYDLACGPSLKWTLVCIAPGPGNADAWNTLDSLLAFIEAADVTVELARPGAYTLSAGTDPQPALYVTLSPEGR